MKNRIFFTLSLLFFVAIPTFSNNQKSYSKIERKTRIEVNFFNSIKNLFSSDDEEEESGLSKKQIEEIYSKYIIGVTGNIISVKETINIRFNFPTDPTKLDQAIEIEPKTSGEFKLNGNEVIFTPKKPLSPGTKYTVKVNLNTLFADIAETVPRFSFNFQTKEQQVELDFEKISFSEKNNSFQTIEGKISTADFAEAKDIESILTITDGRKKIKINWTHSENGEKHNFTSEPIKRRKEEFSVKASWNAKPIGALSQGEKSFKIYKDGDFELIDYIVYNTPEKKVTIQFSMYLNPSQNLSKLIDIKNDKNARLVAEENLLHIYAGARNTNEIEITIKDSLKDVLNNKLARSHNIGVVFTPPQPAVSWKHKGGLIPANSGKMLIPFTAQTLKAVDLTIIQVFDENIVHFFHDNEINTRKNIKRVGRPVFRKTLDLRTLEQENLYKNNQFNIDLSEFISLEPGALYVLSLDIRPSQSLYVCPHNNPEHRNRLDSFDKGNWDYEEKNKNESSYWDYYEESYNDDWRYRNDPCYPAFYTNGKRKTEINILISNFGIIVKKEEPNNYIAYVTDLLTTEPLENVEVCFLNFQGKEIAKTTTAKGGVAKVSINQEKGLPYAATIKKGKERGYIKLETPAAISLSNFDVSGDLNSDGVKGFIYGERGVWRPGDTMHLNFILEDKKNTLPDGYPIIFTLTDPQGQAVYTTKTEKSSQTIYNFDSITSINAPTGKWLATVTVGLNTFSLPLKIETVKPNRIKFDMEFKEERLSAKQKAIGTIKASWMHGAPASNLHSEFDMFLTPTTTRFKGYYDFIFQDPTKNFYTDRTRVFEGKLNSSGEATILLDIGEKKNAPGFLNAYFSGKVYEPGGDFSIDAFNIAYSPYTSYVGVKLPKGDASKNMLLTDIDHKVEIVSLQQDGTPNANAEIEVSLYQISWKWWWDKTEEDKSVFVRSNYSRRLSTDKISTNSKGEGSWTLRVNYPSWGRYFIHVKDLASGHSTGEIAYIDWPGWAGSPQRGNGGVSTLSFSTDKNSYNLGESINLSIPGTIEGGRALITLEKGSEIIGNYWVNTKEKQTDLTIKTNQKMSPNIYISIHLIQPFEKANDSPIRLFGVESVQVIDNSTMLKPIITTKETFSPESEVEILVSEENKQGMFYTVAVVDEGLLDLTNFKTPNPWFNFYRKEYLTIKTWDMYNFILEKTGAVAGSTLSIGGSDALSAAKNTKSNKFEPVIEFFGPFYLKPGQTDSVKFKLPNYVGAVRTMIVGASSSGAYGVAEKMSYVKNDLMILPTFPTVVGAGEKIQLPINVFNYNDDLKEVIVKVETEGLIKNNSSAGQKLLFSKAGETVIYFELEADKELGAGAIRVTATGGKTTVTTDIEVTIDSVNPQITEISEFFLEPNKSVEIPAEIFGVKGSNIQKLEITALKPINMEKRLSYLIQYPHGCIEQTTSGVLPQVFLEKTINLNKNQKAEVEKNIKAGIQRLTTFATSSGGLSYWPGGDTPNEWGTSYAGHFFVSAKLQGYSVPEKFFNNWVSYQTKRANEWTESESASLQAYRLYTLAYAEKPAFSAMNRFIEAKNRSSQDSWMLAAALALSGNKDAAKKVAGDAGIKTKEYNYDSQTYGSSLRDKAMILYCMNLMENSSQSGKLYEEISTALNKEDWMSTQTTAYCLLAAATFNNKGEAETKQIEVTYPNNKQDKWSFTDKIFIKEISPTTGNLTVKNTSGQSLFVKLVNSGIPYESREKDSNAGLSMAVRYFDNKTNKQISDLSSIAHGTDIIIEVEVKNISGYTAENIALSHNMPTGWQILNSRLNTDSNILSSSSFDYQDIRDRVIYTYFDLKKGESRTFRYIVNSSYRGSFYLPAINCQPMYDNTVYATIKGQRIQIK
ncbi:MAG: Ig-like domain-containing protein [Spirochaetales bacterium]|nr:Ig-like domain-containing protein [Spirochaetales bacterium]